MRRRLERFWGLAVLAALIIGAGVLPAPAAAGQTASEAVFDMSKLSIEALAWLQGLIRINTTNPPGNELAAAQYVAGILEKEGIQSQIVETTPGRAFLVAHLLAGPVPDPSRALLLMAHLDVVGVERDKWTVDPFEGVVKDGYLYGRGAIDDKGMVIANVATLVALKRTGARLSRDVILLAEPDEEQGGASAGMVQVVEKYWDKVACAYALNEGGEVLVKDGKVQYIGVQASEKVPVNVQLIATGTSGHASVPRPDDPVTHLATAISKIGEYQAPVQLNSVTREYFEQLAGIEDEETGKWMRALDTSDRGDHAARILSNENPFWNAMLRDTVAPTMLQAGVRPNVVPGEARGMLNIRLLPGNLVDPFVSKLKEIVNDPQIQFDVDTSIGQPAPSSSTDSDLYRTIGTVATKLFPGATELPMMSTYATDSAELRQRSVQAYGLLPFPLTEDDLLRMHGNDERIPLDAFRKGVEFLYDIVDQFAVAK